MPESHEQIQIRAEVVDARVAKIISMCWSCKNMHTCWSYTKYGLVSALPEISICAGVAQHIEMCGGCNQIFVFNGGCKTYDMCVSYTPNI